jgi:hypothetical protein
LTGGPNSCIGAVFEKTTPHGQREDCKITSKEMAENSTKIAQQELRARSATVWAHIQTDGSLCLLRGDSGDGVKQFWGDEDYDFWVDVPSSEIGKLLLLLLKEKYNGNIEALDEFKVFCESNGITCQFMNQYMEWS